MLQQIADLVEFDLKRFSEAQVVEDFNHKFIKSILKIDDKYLIISHLEPTVKGLSLHTFDTNYNEKIINTLRTIEKVLPKTGLYSSPYGLLYLYRTPRRQWIKSLALESNYDMKVLKTGLNGDKPTLWNTVLAEEHTYQKESIIYQDTVYLHWKKVGKLVDNIIHVTKEIFFEEIKELWNQQYQIILDVNNPKPKAEKLILDF